MPTSAATLRAVIIGVKNLELDPVTFLEILTVIGPPLPT
jgi:hypothetical protein